MLTQEKLKKLLHYSPETGEFRWRVFRGNTAKAGSVAGCLKSDGYRTLHVGVASTWSIASLTYT